MSLSGGAQGDLCDVRVFEPVEAAMMGWYNNGWGWGSGFGMLLMLVVWGGLIALGIWAVSRLTRGSGQQAGQQAQPPLETPRQILDRRFASGELTAEQYAEARRVLEGRSSTGTSPQA